MIKRLLDITGAILGIILLAPVFILICLLIWRKMGRPIVFQQTRPGLDGKPFAMLKLRTMTSATNEHGQLLPDAERLTNFGRFLRSTSLDELPELWNVLKGDMSLVGPRPLLMQYLPLYSDEQARRHEVRPGITGWAQINGRNNLSWQQKFNLDIWYVNNQNVYLDIKIILLTIKKVVARSNINQTGEATATAFTGNKEDS